MWQVAFLIVKKYIKHENNLTFKSRKQKVMSNLITHALNNDCQCCFGNNEKILKQKHANTMFRPKE